MSSWHSLTPTIDVAALGAFQICFCILGLSTAGLKRGKVAEETRSAGVSDLNGEGRNQQRETISPAVEPNAPPRDNSVRGNGSAPRREAKRRTNHNKRPPGNRRRAPLYAALDLGTNNCRLLIVRAQDKGYRVVDGFTRIVRLGEGVSQTGKLDAHAMERTFDALKQCAGKLAHHAPASYRLIATEACRAAQNAPEFLERVKRELGIELEIIDRKTEAQLAVTGCSDLVEKDTKGALLFDIGGGSSELAWMDFRGGRPKQPSRLATSIRSWQSLPVGVVTIAEKFGGVDVPPEKFEAMVDYVTQQFRHFRGREKLKQMIKEHPVHLIGTSGTVTTLAGLHLGLERYERSKVDGLWMNADQLTDTMRVLLAMPYERRVANPCIGKDRADLVIPGCAIFEAIRREWPTERVRVADRGLREGMLISLMEADRAKMATRRRSKSNRKRQNNG